MKKLFCLFLSMFVLSMSIPSICLAQSQAIPPTSTTPPANDGGGTVEQSARGEITWSQKWFFDNPVTVLDAVYGNANRDRTDQVQHTDLDSVSSNPCSEVSVDGRFTITRTLCNLKMLSKDYLQYVMYIWLTAATILLIRNGFKIVTSADQGKEIEKFKKNLLYIVIWVFLLIWFYYVIDIFVSVVNLIVE